MKIAVSKKDKKIIRNFINWIKNVATYQETVPRNYCNYMLHVFPTR